MLNFNVRRANICVLLGAVVMVVGTLAVGLDASDAERQAVVVVSFGIAFATLFFLDRREDRARERVERESFSGHPRRNA